MINRYILISYYCQFIEKAKLAKENEGFNQKNCKIKNKWLIEIVTST